MIYVILLCNLFYAYVAIVVVKEDKWSHMSVATARCRDERTELANKS